MDYDPKIIPEGINTSREHPLREFFVLVLGLAATIIVIVSLLTYSADFLIQYIPVEKENEWFSEKLVTQSDEHKTVKPDPAVTEIEQYLSRLIHQLLPDDRRQYSFSVRLLASETPNAFIIPGGHIFVTTGLLESVHSENGLAMVLGHEMGHQFYRHPLKSAGRGVVISLALLVISGADGGGFAQSFIGNTAMLTSLGFSRAQEREADTVGVELLQRLYGHSRGASEFFETIKTHPETDSDVPVFLSTHPGVEERLTYLRERAAGSGALRPLPEFIARYLAANPARKK